MKIVHTSDWHLGRTLHGYSLIEDQRYMLEQLLSCIKEEQVDALIIAGDVYDKAIPNEAAVELFNTFLGKVILEYKIDTLIIAGNHDSHERLNFGSEIFKNQHLYITGKCKKGYEKVTLQKGEVEMDVYMLPYSEPAEVRQLAGDESIKRHDEAMGYLIKKMLEEKRRVPTVLVTHAFVTGGDISDSERRLSVVGGAELVDANHFQDFTYTALGHLHKRQAMGSEHIRYSGSLLKYSVSEANQKKGFVMVEIGKEGLLGIQEREYKPLREVRILKGSLEKLIEGALTDACCEDYVYARIVGTDIEDSVARLRNVYPNILGTEYVEERVKEGIETEETSSDFLSQKQKSITEVFMEFLNYTSDLAFEEEELNYIQEVITEIEEERDET
ncbi:exonuclease SbcCD subunit D [Sporanaerobium hydrogeniformans]|uniref:exonuclease SbcCD subunit D n=1 Tax=Sporanaerobium hydrogeniformans TaxID=3072179 RepID=UPI0015D49E07|nr:exonuclease SbcCD subunit D C-terminal domain-containing protein [Sporanaerobium hydrogeniformans]